MRTWLRVLMFNFDKHVKAFCFQLGLLAHPPHTALERVIHAFDLGRQNPSARRLPQTR